MNLEIKWRQVPRLNFWLPSYSKIPPIYFMNIHAPIQREDAVKAHLKTPWNYDSWQFEIQAKEPGN